MQLQAAGMSSKEQNNNTGNNAAMWWLTMKIQFLLFVLLTFSLVFFLSPSGYRNKIMKIKSETSSI